MDCCGALIVINFSRAQLANTMPVAGVNRICIVSLHGSYNAARSLGTKTKPVKEHSSRVGYETDTH